MPAASTAVACTNTSLPPPSGAIKPKPLEVLKNFTVPIVIESFLRWLSVRRVPGRCLEIGCRREEVRLSSRRAQAARDCLQARFTVTGLKLQTAATIRAGPVSGKVGRSSFAVAAKGGTRGLGR